MSAKTAVIAGVVLYLMSSVAQAEGTWQIFFAPLIEKDCRFERDRNTTPECRYQMRRSTARRRSAEVRERENSAMASNKTSKPEDNASQRLEAQGLKKEVAPSGAPLPVVTIIKRKQCDPLMDRCYSACKAKGTSPSECNQTCTANALCGWPGHETYGQYLEHEIEALGVKARDDRKG